MFLNKSSPNYHSDNSDVPDDSDVPNHHSDDSHVPMFVSHKKQQQKAKQKQKQKQKNV